MCKRSGAIASGKRPSWNGCAPSRPSGFRRGATARHELRAVLDAFEKRLVAELAKSAAERRQTNDKIDRLARH